MRARTMAGALVLAVLTPPALAAVMTNKDVILLLEAGMAEDVVVQAIRTSQTKFDTSAPALVQLKKKGATPGILKAMMQPAAGHEPVARPQPVSPPPATLSTVARERGSAAPGTLNPEEVIAVSEGAETPLNYIIPGTRTAARALGFGGVATYAVLNGPRAQRRLPNTADFIVSVPKSAQASNYVTLANFAVRSNNSREVLIGGGFMSYSTGIHPDRIVAIVAEPLEDQSRAREGFVLQRVRVSNPMRSGEYALVLYTGEVRTMGVFAQAANSYFDFGVD